MIDHMVAEGFLSPAFAAMIAVETDPDALLARFRAYQPPAKRWSTARKSGDLRVTHPNEPAPSASFCSHSNCRAVIADAKGRILLVRKRSSFFFMQPGGKREEGETDLYLAKIPGEVKPDANWTKSQDRTAANQQPVLARLTFRSGFSSLSRPLGRHLDRT